jgi:hypothetical protein
MPTFAQLTEATAGLQTAYEKHGGKAPIPWLNILPAIIALITSCLQPTPTPAAVKAACANDQERDFYTTYTLINEFGVGWRRQHKADCAAVSLAFKEYVAGASDELIASFLIN